MGQLAEALVDNEADALMNLALAPFLFLNLLTIPYLENPLMKTPAKFLVLALGVFFIIWAIELLEAALWIQLLVGVGFAAVFAGLEAASVSPFVLGIIYEILSVFASIGWIGLISNLIIDNISFLAFYFSIDKVVLSAILLSVGNSIGDFFGNAALAKQGEEVMGLLASYAGQIFNNYMGFGLSQLGATTVGNIEFDIFAQGYDPVQTPDKPYPVASLYVTLLLGVVVFSLIFQVVAYFVSGFTVGKGYAAVLAIIYAAFFVGSLVFGILTRQD